MLLARKLKNEIAKALNKTSVEDIRFTLRNITINGAKRGCSGHITNSKNGVCVYVTTEHSCYAPIGEKSMVRYAADDKDFSSYNMGIRGQNVFIEDAKVASVIAKMLEDNRF